MLAQKMRRMAADQRAKDQHESLPHGSLAHALCLVRPLFAAEWYGLEYADVQGDAEALLLHFCERGWKEGRNPHPGFDTVSYLISHPDVAHIGWNPFYHYVLAGHAENRLVVPAHTPREAAVAVLGRDPGDWVEILRPELDVAFYATQFAQPPDGSFDLVAHFAYRGWIEERNPNHSFDVHAALSRRPELLAARLNPLLAEIVGRPPPPPPPPDLDDPALVTTRFPREALFGIVDRLQALRQNVVEPCGETVAFRDDPVERCVADHLDQAFYLAINQDVQQHAMDPVEHYCRIGWAEGRNPTAWFDTEFYLCANPDIAASQVNPFWHYLVEGKREGRRPHRPGGFKRDIIEHAMDPDARTKAYVPPEPTGLLIPARLERLLRTACEVSKGLVISVSHDCAVRVTGGIQLFIAEEQVRFGRQGMLYLHLYPFVPMLRLGDPDARGTLINLAIDGRDVGVTRYTDLAEVLKKIERRDGERRDFLVHCLLGHHIPDLIGLHRASGSRSNVFWVHDYSSLCLGYTLLRNDVTYCHAPPPDSMACRVCVYGERRTGHLAQMHALFEAIPFHVVAPSQAALSIWLQHSDLPHLSAVAHPHCDLVPVDEPAPVRDLKPVRVAFIGFARAHKGWPLWVELVSRARRLGAYEFFHLGTAETAEAGGGMRHVVAVTCPGHPDAMSDTVKNLGIDLVLVLSTWPETFSYVTYEALAGGADVVCLQDSGNVADTVLNRGRGVVFTGEESLFSFFTSLRAVEYVRLCREQGPAFGQLVREGTTATLDLVDA